MIHWNRRISLALTLGIFALIGFGCADDQLVNQQHTELEQRLTELDKYRQVIEDDSRSTFTYCYSRLESGVYDCKFKKLRDFKRALTTNEERGCEQEVMPKPCLVLKAFLATGKELPLDLLWSCEKDVANRDEVCACRQEGCSFVGPSPENLTCFATLGDELCSRAEWKLVDDELSCIGAVGREECDGLERIAVETLLETARGVEDLPRVRLPH